MKLLGSFILLAFCCSCATSWKAKRYISNNELGELSALVKENKREISKEASQYFELTIEYCSLNSFEILEKENIKFSRRISYKLLTKAYHAGCLNIFRALSSYQRLDFKWMKKFVENHVTLLKQTGSSLAVANKAEMLRKHCHLLAEMKSKCESPLNKLIELGFLEAVKTGTGEQVEMLLNSNPGLIHVTDPYGSPPIILAAKIGNEKVIESLVKAGAHINEKQTQQPELPSILSKYGIDHVRKENL